MVQLVQPSYERDNHKYDMGALLMAVKIKEIYQMLHKLNMGNMTEVIVLLKNCPEQGEEYETAHHPSASVRT